MLALYSYSSHHTALTVSLDISIIVELAFCLWISFLQELLTPAQYLGGGIYFIVTPPNSNAFSDWRGMRHVRASCGLNLSNSLGRLKLTISLGKQQLERWTRT